MTRVVRPKRYVMSVDHDSDTWSIDHPDRDLTRAIIHFNSDQRFAIRERKDLLCANWTCS